MELTLIVEAYARRDLRLRNTPRKERCRETDTPMGHVRMRWQPHFVTESTAESKLVGSRVRGQFIK